MPYQLGASRGEKLPRHLPLRHWATFAESCAKTGRATGVPLDPWEGKTVIATNVSFAVEALLVRGWAGWASLECFVMGYRAELADTVDGFKLCSTEPHLLSVNGGHRPVIMPTSYLGLTHY